jgi:L-amino acid N-acyltransferase YncA
MLSPDHAKPHRRVYQRTLDRYTFRLATIDDVDGIVALWPEHWEEAHYKARGIEPDEPRYRQWTEDKIRYLDMVFLVAIERDSSRIVGFFAYSLDHNFSVKPVAVMGTFYVRKEHRRSAVPALLFDLAIEAMQEDGACALHAPIASESLSSRALENTFRKHGFTVIGTMMGRAL